MTEKDSITQEYLKECFTYNHDTGDVFWKKRPSHHFNSSNGQAVSNARTHGKQAGSKYHEKKCNKSYYQCCIRVKGVMVRYSLHRLIWILIHNETPNEIDHINGNGMDNRLSNLRNVTHKENQQNTKLSIKNTSGVCGVWWNKRVNKWMAGIKEDSKKIHLGYFLNFNDAVIARKMKEYNLGYHQNHGSDRLIYE